VKGFNNGDLEKRAGSCLKRKDHGKVDMMGLENTIRVDSLWKYKTKLTKCLHYSFDVSNRTKAYVALKGRSSGKHPVELPIWTCDPSWQYLCFGKRYQFDAGQNVRFGSREVGLVFQSFGLIPLSAYEISI
jgi:hypothetical protein